MLSEFIYKNTILGEFYENHKVFVFFGNANADYNLLKEIFNYEFSTLKQVHKNSVVQVESNIFTKNVEADGQWTKNSNIALVIETADCLPVFWSVDHLIVALHCGWRSLAANIIDESYKKTQSKPTHAFTGPHIQFSSFEVENDVAQCFPNNCKQVSKEKFHVNLVNVAKQQLAGAEMTTSTIDTLTHSSYNSYRRDQLNAKRNINFIALK